MMPTRFRKLSSVLLPALLLIALNDQPAHAIQGALEIKDSTECHRSKMENCSRFVVCPNKSSLRKANNRYYCKKTKEIRTNSKPSCVRHKGRNDWTWNDQINYCVRTTVTGTVKKSRENAKCGAGRHFVQGSCQDVIYSKPSLVISRNKLPYLKAARSQQEALQRLLCPVSTSLSQNGNGSFLCHKFTNKVTHTPFCKKKAGFTYKWDGEYCARNRKVGGKTVQKAGLAYCRNGFTFDGKTCTRKADIRFYAPRLKK